MVLQLWTLCFCGHPLEDHRRDEDDNPLAPEELKAIGAPACHFPECDCDGFSLPRRGPLLAPVESAPIGDDEVPF
jgi:hypothetical protein